MRPSSSTTSASRNAARLPPESTRAVQVSTEPSRAGFSNDTLSSALAEKTLRARAYVSELAPMAESAKAARKPPWTMPVGLAKRSSATMPPTVRPGSRLSMHTMPRVRSQLGGTCTRASDGGNDLHLRRAARPVLIAQEALEQLAALGAGQLVAQLPRARPLVAGEAVVDERLER